MRIALWLGVYIVLASTAAHAAVSINMNPDPIPNTAFLGGSQVSNTGQLSASGGSPHVDLDPPSMCSGPASGTFDEIAVGGSTSNIDLNTAQTVTVKWTPSANTRGTQTCRINVKDHSGGAVLGHFNITATAQKHQTLIVTQTVLNSGTPVVPPAATTVFGSLRFNDAAPVHTSAVAFTVQNQGDIDLAITGIAVTGGDYAVTAGPAMKTLTPNSTQIWTVTFNPSTVSAATNDKTSTLTFTSDDGGTAGTNTNLALAGTATTAAISVNNVDFLTVAAGSSPAADITVTNSAAAGFSKGTLSVSQGAIAGGSWFTFNGCGNGTTCNYTSPGLQVTTTQVVSVRCSPPSGTADNTVQTATVTFTSDADGTLLNVANLTCKSVQGVLGTNPPSLAYTSQLIGTAMQQMVTITNSGGAPATYVYQLTGAQAASFSVATTGAQAGCGIGAAPKCMLAAGGGQLTFTVTYTAAIEGDEGAGLNLVSTDATPYPQMSLSGHGVDKHIVYPLSVQFNDEFRNPGSMATPQPVRIENSGEYPLSVSSVVVQGEPQWALDDGFPFDVPGATGAGPGARDVMVLFKPNAIGKVDNGLMQLQSNDALRGNISIVLLGNGKERAVKTFPPTIELGDTGAGVPTRLSLVDPSQMLVMTNMDDITDFTIREIKMQGIDADIDKIFTIQTMDGDSVGGTVLPHGNQPRTFDVLFTPPQLGNYEANIAIYLDEDSESQVTIPIHGRALFVDAHGGGGCSTTDTSGAGGMLFAIGAFAFARRRRTA